MPMDLTKHFAKYEAVVSIVDGIFNQVKSQYPKEVFCREKCSDCCYAIFDLTIIEALYLKHQFDQAFSGNEKYDLIQKAAKADRALHKLKRDAHREVQAGKNEVDVLARMARERIRCPLLGDDNLCLLYNSRPITCRIYGIPTSSSGMSHICGRTNFTEGEQYPTVNMDKIYTQMQLISAEMIADIKSSHIKMHEMLIPVSMALVTDFNNEYLGVKASS